MSKVNVFLSLVSVSAGVALVVSELLALSTASATTSNFTPNQAVGISLSQEKLFVKAKYISNIIPGVSESDTLVITNTGSQPEDLIIKNILSGDIFLDNGKTGTKLGEAVGPDGRLQGISMDYKATNDSPRFKFDDHPLQITYSIYIPGLLSDRTISVGPFSTNNTSPAFRLAAGEHALVSYTYALPLAAHNDYQGTTGTMYISLNAFSNNNLPPGGRSKTPGVVRGATLPTTGFGVDAILAAGIGLVTIGLSVIFFGLRRKRS